MPNFGFKSPFAKLGSIIASGRSAKGTNHCELRSSQSQSPNVRFLALTLSEYTMFNMNNVSSYRRSRFLPFVFLTIGLLLPTAAQSAETLEGKAVKVADGDTLTLLVGTEQIRIRLHGIDAPEKGQAFGSRSRQALSDSVFGQNVRVDDLGKDRYGRTLEIIRLGDKNINTGLVRKGWPWRYRKYALHNRELSAAEESAR